MADVSRILGILGHPTRLDAVLWLAQHGPAPLGEIADYLRLVPEVAGELLRPAVTWRLLTKKRRGRNVVYAVDFEAADALAETICKLALDAEESAIKAQEGAAQP